MSDYEKARSISLLAIHYMDRHKVAPTPDHYAVWYTYAAGTNQALIGEIDAIVKSGEPFRDFALKDLHQRFVKASDGSALVENAGAKVEAEVARIMELLSDAERDAKVYGASLDSAKTGLSAPKPALSAIVAGLLESTREMMSKNKELEDSLHSSSDEVALLRQDLAAATREASTDALTELFNRKAFEDQLKRAAATATARKEPLSLIFADVDEFKKFNDSFGHALGDQVLRLVARAISEHMPPGAVAARFGGDEFAILLPGICLTDAVDIGHKIRKTIEAKKIIKRNTGEQLRKITTSLGAAEFRSGEDVPHLFSRADRALYAAKAGGRNRLATEEDDEASAVKID